MRTGNNKFKYEHREVAARASGRWDEIIESICPDLSHALKKPAAHFMCPHHASTDGDGFRFFKDVKEKGGGICNTCGPFADGFAIIMWDQDISFPESIEQVALYLGMDRDHEFDPNSIRQSQPKTKTEAQIQAEILKVQQENKRKTDVLKKTWNEAVALDSVEAEPARLYLARRGLSLRYALKSRVMKFHSRLPYYKTPKELLGYYPAIVSMAFDSNWEPVTIHRIYLDHEGYKADVPQQKKIMAYSSDKAISGGAIPLVDLNKHLNNCVNPETGESYTALAVCEGIETALAIIEASEGRLPVWPAISAELMAKFQPPEAVDYLCIYVDQDVSQAGRNAAIRLKQNLSGENLTVKGYLPPVELMAEGAKSVDWLDVFNMRGADSVIMPRGLI